MEKKAELCESWLDFCLEKKNVKTLSVKCVQNVSNSCIQGTELTSGFNNFPTNIIGRLNFATYVKPVRL